MGDHFPRPYDANFRGITNNPFRWQRPLGKFIFVLFCCCIRRDEEKETHNINVVGKMSKFEISNGHNWGAIWSYRAVSTTPGIARTSSCSGEGSQGAWGLGRWEKLRHVYFFVIFEFLKTNGKITRSVKFARIGLILIQNESPHRALDSPGGFGQSFQKIGGK